MKGVFLYADSSHANARCCYSGGYRYFGSAGNPTGRIRLNLRRPYEAVERDIRESDPETAYAVSSLSLFPGITRKRKHFSKGFLPAGNPGSSVYDLYMIHIAPYGDSSKVFGKFFKVSDIPLPAQYLRRHQSPPCACCKIQAL